MDDYTWRKRLAARRRRRRLEGLFVAFLIFFVSGCVIWYFTSYTKTPGYSIRAAIDALHDGDTEKFGERIDFSSVLTKAYDDLTSDLFKYDTALSDRDRSLFENFYVLIRPQMCKGAIEIINTRLETGKWTLPEDILKGRQLGIDFDLLLERSLIRHTTIVDVDNVEHLGNKATADIKVVEDYSQTPFTLKVTLENFGNVGWQVGSFSFELFGTTWKFPGMSFSLGASEWKVISVDNYREYLDAVSPILKQGLATYIESTQEIVNRYNNIFAGQQSNFITMQRTANGVMSDAQKIRIADFINHTVIPTLESRQAELDAVFVPNGAQFLAELRKESTSVTILAWQYYANGLTENNTTFFDTAESLHKQELTLDRRIEEVVHSSAVAKIVPTAP